jgi:uncharacterized protein YerC
MMGCCYLLEFPNGKVYVGITTKTVEERFAGHCKKSHRQQRSLYCAMHKYGAASITAHTLAESEDWAELCRYERMFIAFYGSNQRGSGYNMTCGGEGVAGLSEELREVRSRNARRQWDDPERRQRRRAEAARAARKAWNNPVICERLRDARRKQWEDPEYRAAMVSVARQQKPRALAALAENVPDYGIYTGMGYTEPVEFVDRVRVALLRSHRSYKDIAKTTGVGFVTISNISTGKTAYPTDATLRRLAGALGVADDQLSPPT